MHTFIRRVLSSAASVLQVRHSRQRSSIWETGNRCHGWVVWAPRRQGDCSCAYDISTRALTGAVLQQKTTTSMKCVARAAWHVLNGWCCRTMGNGWRLDAVAVVNINIKAKSAAATTRSTLAPCSSCITFGRRQQYHQHHLHPHSFCSEYQKRQKIKNKKTQRRMASLTWAIAADFKRKKNAHSKEKYACLLHSSCFIIFYFVFFQLLSYLW